MAMPLVVAPDAAKYAVAVLPVKDPSGKEERTSRSMLSAAAFKVAATFFHVCPFARSWSASPASWSSQSLKG